MRNVRWLVPLGISALFAIGLGCSQQSNSAKAEETSPIQVFTFPVARQGEVIRHTFQVRNHNKSVIQIEDISSSCGCTVAEGVELLREIPPGESIDVPVQLDLSGKRGDVSTKVTLTFHDHDTPVQLIMKGSVAVDYPQELSFGPIKSDARETRVITLTTFPGQPPIRVFDIEHDNDFFTANVISNEDRRDAVEIKISLNADLPYGHFNKSLTVSTNDREVPLKRIRVTGKVLSLLEASKKDLFLGTVRGVERSLDRFDLYSPYGQPLKLITIENSRPDCFAYTISQQIEPSRVSISVTSLPNSNNDLSETSIVKGVLTVNARIGDTDDSARIEVYLLVPNEKTADARRAS